jgi:hypothetical protein
MGKSSARSGIDIAAADLTLDQLNVAIWNAKLGWETGGSSQGRRAFFKRLVALEAQREAIFAIDAPKRRYNRQQK